MSVQQHWKLKFANVHSNASLHPLFTSEEHSLLQQIKKYGLLHSCITPTVFKLCKQNENVFSDVTARRPDAFVIWIIRGVKCFRRGVWCGQSAAQQHIQASSSHHCCLSLDINVG